MNTSLASSSSSLSLSSSCKRKRDADSFDEYRYKRPKNDVFVNYSFDDTGKGFVSHLKGALKLNGFSISDNTMLPIGLDKSSELLKAIEDSEIYLVVLSTNYAFSVSSLDELVLINDCFFKFKNRKVFPIFFNVDPSHIKSQQQSFFNEAFKTHKASGEHPERVHKWNQALKDTSQLSGLSFQNGDEADLIQQVLQKLKQMQNPLELFDAIHPVGIESRAQEIISKLRLGDNVFIILAVLGIGGSGKTTIVKAVYDRIVSDFDANCFIENILDYDSSDWKDVLQKRVISSLTGNNQFYNVGASKIKKILTNQKVLLVLDDVDKYEQLQALGIHLGSFGGGSRIIVTTRNQQTLSVLPNTPYEISLLNERESSELFTGLAFRKDEPVDEKFVNEVVFHAEGLPLVLEVWGRHFKCHERKRWSSVLETLKRIPHEDIQKKLQMSFDSLTNRSKKLFLDVVYFFYGMSKDLVVKVLQDENSGFYIDNEIQYLIDKSLVKTGYDNNTVIMHHAIRQMGQEVIRRENEYELGQRTRLMGRRDVVCILRDCSGTEVVEGIHMESSYGRKRETVQVAAFKKMSNLRFIHISDYESRLQWSFTCNDDISSFSFKKLKYLKWDYFPFKCIDNIDMGNVVVIRLLYSKMEKLWEGFKSLKKLRILDVRYSSSLTRTGNFSGLEKLEELFFGYCTNLKELHRSIGCLKNLVFLNLSDCRQLKRFPWDMVVKLKSLVRLELSGCPIILNISRELVSLKSLTYLCLSGNGFPSLPYNLCQLQELKRIGLSGCANLKSIPDLPLNIEEVIANGCSSLVNLPSNTSELHFLNKLDLNRCFKLEPESLIKVSGLTNLHTLSMTNCNVSHVSSEIGNLVTLKFLDLSENTFSSLPDSFSNLSELNSLWIKECSELELLPLLPSSLRIIEAHGCWSLDVMPYHDSLQTAYNFHSKMFEESLFTTELSICLSEEVVPNWCSYGDCENALCFEAPIRMDRKICGVVICATITCTELDRGLEGKLSPIMLNKTKEITHRFGNCLTFFENSMCVMFNPLNDTTLVVEAGDTVILKFDENYLMVVSCGLSLIYEGDVLDSMLLIQKSNATEPILPVPWEMVTQDGKVFFSSSEEEEEEEDDDDDNDNDDDDVISSPVEDDEYDFDKDDDNDDLDDDVLSSLCEDDEYYFDDDICCNCS